MGSRTFYVCIEGLDDTVSSLFSVASARLGVAEFFDNFISSSVLAVRNLASGIPVSLLSDFTIAAGLFDQVSSALTISPGFFMSCMSG